MKEIDQAMRGLGNAEAGMLACICTLGKAREDILDALPSGLAEGFRSRMQEALKVPARSRVPLMMIELKRRMEGGFTQANPACDGVFSLTGISDGELALVIEQAGKDELGEICRILRIRQSAEGVASSSSTMDKATAKKFLASSLCSRVRPPQVAAGMFALARAVAGCGNFLLEAVERKLPDEARRPFGKICRDLASMDGSGARQRLLSAVLKVMNPEGC